VRGQGAFAGCISGECTACFILQKVIAGVGNISFSYGEINEPVIVMQATIYKVNYNY